MQTIEQARADMRQWAEDLEALRPNYGSGEQESVAEAWAAARLQFLAACRRYARAAAALPQPEAVKPPPTPLHGP